ncbi:MAG: hypothetical protein AAFQ07_04275, partial [Chloroflexota bacterium]
VALAKAPDEIVNFTNYDSNWLRKLNLPFITITDWAFDPLKDITKFTFFPSTSREVIYELTSFSCDIAICTPRMQSNFTLNGPFEEDSLSKFWYNLLLLVRDVALRYETDEMVALVRFMNEHILEQ